MKRIIAGIICFLMLLTSASTAAVTPQTLEAPFALSLTPEYSEGKVDYLVIAWRITDGMRAFYGNSGAKIQLDYKIDDGSWKYTTQWDSGNLPDPWYAYDASGYFDDVGGNMDFTWNINETHSNYPAFDLANHSYTVRARCGYENGDTGAYSWSPWSSSVSIGKGVTDFKITSLETPLNLKGLLKTKGNGLPYFSFTWDNPQSVITADSKTSGGVSADLYMKVDNGAWELTGGGSLNLAGACDYDPIDNGGLETIDIEAATYYFKIQYVTRWDGGRVKSQFSNTVSIGTPAFYSKASDYAVSFLDKADKLGIITDRMQGQDMTQYITREEFAEIAVKFYEMATGRTADPKEINPFKDCSNPEVLKALNLKITAGTGDGTTFEPNARLLRQQMATMITNTLRACFPDFVLNTAGQPDFKDQKSFASYAVNPAKFMAKYGITAGDGKGNFVPNNYCTRQEAVIFLVKSYESKNLYIN